MALTQHFGLTPSAVSQWRSNGVPSGRMKAVREFTNGAVTLDDMLPDPAWPHAGGRPCIDVAAPQCADAGGSSGAASGNAAAKNAPVCATT